MGATTNSYVSRFLIGALLLNACLLLETSLRLVSYAQVTTAITSDGTLGTIVKQDPGNVYNIDRGTIKGNNQFHSFDKFSVGAGDIASFNGPNGIENIISRVTGRQISHIDGTLRSTIDQANLFFLNPAGVIFGPGAKLQVSGSFHVSTANLLHFEDNAEFHADPSQHSVLTVASPEAFGFLGANPANIVITGSTLQVLPGKTLSVIGGDIEMMGGELSARDGEVNLASVASSREVPVKLSDLNVNSFLGFGEIEITQGTFIDAGGDGGGTIVIRGGRLLVDNSFLFADTLGDTDGAELGVDVVVGNVDLDNGSVVFTGTEGEGRSGNTMLQVDNLRLTGGAQIDTRTFGAGKGGTVRVRATNSITIDGTDSENNPSGIFSRTQTEDGGDSGDIVLEARHLAIARGGEISSSSSGDGQGGMITVTASDAVTIAGTVGNPSGLLSNALRTGDAGSIVLSSPSLHIEEGTIQAATRGEGRGGTIDLKVNTVTLTHGADINTVSEGVGKAGDIILQARDIQLREGALVSAQSAGTGDAGTICITAADTLLLRGNSAVTTEATQASGGNIEVTVPTVVRLQDSAITATVRGGPGTFGGNITVEAEFVILENSQIISDAFQGRGGDITIKADVLLEGPTSDVSAMAQDSVVGIDGEVDIRAPVTDLSEVVMPLPQRFVQTAALLRDPCTARLREGKVSSLVVGGREGVLPEPGGVLPPSFYVLGQTATEPAENRDQMRDRLASQKRGLGVDAWRPLEGRERQWQGLAQATLELECAKWMQKRER